jgi:hypothetical protein
MFVQKVCASSQDALSWWLMTSALIFLAIAAACATMLWAAYQIEPHWVSKDAGRMVCYGQGLGRNGQTDGRWREVRVAKVSNDTVEVRPRRGGLTTSHRDGASRNPKAPVQKRLPKASYWKVIGASDTPPKRRAIYLLDGGDDESLPFMYALRLPANSKAIPMLETMAAYRHTSTAAAPTPEMTQSAEQPDQD